MSSAASTCYWGHGGNWPGEDRKDLVDKVLGRGEVFPPLVACYGVFAALAVAAALPLMVAGLVVVPVEERWIRGALVLGAGVFGLRGLGGFLPFLEAMAAPAFVRLNRRIYSPLCVGLAASLAVLGLL